MIVKFVSTQIVGWKVSTFLKKQMCQPTLLGLVLSTMAVSFFKMSRALVCFAFTFLAAAAADFVAALLFSGVSPESSIPMLLQWDMLSGPITLNRI